MTILLYIFKIHLISVYFFIKLFHKQKEQVCFLSRQSNELSLNYKMIMQELDKENIHYEYICKKINSKINDSIRTHGTYSNNLNFLSGIFHEFSNVFSYYKSLYSQMILISKSKVVIVDGYNIPVSLLKHKKDTCVIQIWHALGAIKKFGYQVIGNKDGVSSKVAKILKMHNNYDYVLSSVESMNPYFSEAFNVSKDKILTIGTPMVDYMIKGDYKATKEIYKKYPVLKEKENVLYSPTFRNDKRSGLKELIKNFDFSKYNLIITFHPKVYEEIDDKRIIKISPREFLTYDVLKVADYVITDYSALIIDALLAKKKILLYVYDYYKYKEDNGLNINLLEDYPNITKIKASEIINILNKHTYNNKEYMEFSNLYRPNIKNCTKKIIDLIKGNLNGNS